MKILSPETQFFNFLADLKEHAKDATRDDCPSLLREVRLQTQALFCENQELAYQIGIENQMSYQDDNDLWAIDRLTKDYENEISLTWLSSSWDEC